MINGAVETHVPILLVPLAGVIRIRDGAGQLHEKPMSRAAYLRLIARCVDALSEMEKEPS